jgi:hypothetical protein
MKDIYLLSLSYTGNEPTATDATITSLDALPRVTGLAGNKTRLTVRVGYFGYCIADNGVTSCSRDPRSLASLMIRETNASDPLNMLYMATSFHDQTIFSGLMWVGLPIP